MKRIVCALLFALVLSISALAQSPTPLRITEVDGSPSRTNVTRLNFPNGTITVSGQVVTYTPAGGVGMGTVTNTGGNLANNTIVVGAGGADAKTAAGLTTNGNDTITAGIWNGTDIAYSRIAQSPALSVLGVTGNSTADVAGIAAASDNQVLRRSGTAVAFGAVNLASPNAVIGILPIANIATGTPDGTKFVRDDGTLQVPSGGVSNAAGSGVIAKSNGTNLVASLISESLGSVTINSVGTITLGDAGAAANSTTLTIDDTTHSTRNVGTFQSTNAYYVAGLEVVDSTGGGTALAFAGAGTPASFENNLTIKGLAKAGSGPTTLTDAAGKILSAALNTVGVAQGGTSQTTYTKGDLLTAPGGASLNKLAVGTDGFVLTADAASTNGVKWAAGGGGGGATIALDNLASVAINTTLVSDTDNTDDLGTSAKKWKDLYLAGNITGLGVANRIGTPGTNDANADTMMTASGPTKRALTLQGSRAQGNQDPLFAITDFTTGANVFRIASDGTILSNNLNIVSNTFLLPQNFNLAFSTANAGTSGSAGGLGLWFNNSGSGAARMFVAANDTSGIGAMIQNTGGRQRVTADVTKADTTFTILTGLGFNAAASGKYTGKLIIKCNNSVASEGIKFDFNGGTATATAFWAVATESAGGTTVLGTVISTSLAGVINYTTITGETLIEISFSIVVNGAGTVIPRFAENSTAVGTVTVELGSSMWTESMPL